MMATNGRIETAGHASTALIVLGSPKAVSKW